MQEVTFFLFAIKDAVFSSFEAQLLQEEGLVLTVLRDKLNDEYPAGVFIYSETVVCPFTNQPYNMFATAKYPLLLFAGKGEFPVGEVIAHFLPSGHAEGDKTVSLLAEPYGERLF